VDFARDIKPILTEHCVKCHGPEKQKGGLRLDNKGSAFQGGDEGKALVAGKSAESPLVHLVAGLEEDKIMPPKGGRLTASQIGLIRARRGRTMECRWLRCAVITGRCSR
jgi:mono/diheme cytochrome c family protein